MLKGGIDEVGRGALAGPIISAIAVFNCEQSPIEEIADSKKFSSKSKRRKVFQQLLECESLVDFGIGQVDSVDIDRIGIDEANALVFEAALDHLDVRPDRIIVDGVNLVRGWPKDKQVALPKADRLHWQVSAASILAKVIRDDLMTELADLYPEFDCWKTCSGYGVEKHIASIKRYGITPYHRRTFLTKYPQLPEYSRDKNYGGRKI